MYQALRTRRSANTVFSCRCPRLIFLVLLIFALTPTVRADPDRPELRRKNAAQHYLPELLERLRNGSMPVNDFARQLAALASHTTDMPALFVEADKDIPGLHDAVASALVTETEDALIRRLSANALGLKKSAEALLGAEDPATKRIGALFAIAEKIEHLTSTGRVQDLVDYAKGAAGDQAAKRIVDSRTANALHEIAKQNLAEDKPGFALKALAQLGPDWRTEQTSQIALNALKLAAQQISVSTFSAQQWVLDQPDVQQFVAWAEQHETATLPLSAALHGWRAQQALKAGDIPVAETQFRLAIKKRPDPNTNNNELRLSLALSADSAEAYRFGKGRVDELRYSGRLGMIDKLQLLVKGYYGSFLPALAIASVLLFVVAAALSSVSPKTTLPRFRFRPEAEPTQNKGYSRPVTGNDEYGRLLAIFGLDDSASEDEIKQAYRRTVKSYHPDARVGDLTPTVEGADPTQKFIELREVYKRILEIRKSWFGG